MGLFSKLFKSGANSSGHELLPWPGAPAVNDLVLPGGFTRTLYVYDDSPYQSATEGDTIYVEFFPGEAVLCSKASGATVDTRQENAVCYLHRGQPVGVTFSSNADLKLAHEKGIRLFAKASVGKPLAAHGGVRALTLHLPEGPNAARKMIQNYEFYQQVPQDAERISFNEWDEEDFAELADREHWAFKNVRLEYLPVPAGSSAKPHILASSEGGTKIFRLTARNSPYRPIAAALESSENFAVLADRRIAGNGMTGYEITLLHW